MLNRQTKLLLNDPNLIKFEFLMFLTCSRDIFVLMEDTYKEN